MSNLRDAITSSAADFLRATPAEHVEGGRVEIDEAPNVGDYVVVLGRFRARARSSGRDFEVKLSHVWKLAGGRVVLFSNLGGSSETR